MRGLFPDYIDTDATSSAVVPMDLRQFAERVHGNNSLPTVFVRLSFTHIRSHLRIHPSYVLSVFVFGSTAHDTGHPLPPLLATGEFSAPHRVFILISTLFQTGCVLSLLKAEELCTCPGESVYMYGDPLPPQLRADCPTPPCLPAKIGKTSFWWSTAGAVTPAHYDLPHGMLCQVRELSFRGGALCALMERSVIKHRVGLAGVGTHSPSLIHLARSELPRSTLTHSLTDARHSSSNLPPSPSHVSEFTRAACAR